MEITEDRQEAETYNVRRMWKDGPLREWMQERPSSSWGMPYATGGFVNRYVCSQCGRPVSGLYGQGWTCGSCRKSLGCPENIVRGSDLHAGMPGVALTPIGPQTIAEGMAA